MIVEAAEILERETGPFLATSRRGSASSSTPATDG
jgi:hypothetical protein